MNAPHTLAHLVPQGHAATPHEDAACGWPAWTQALQACFERHARTRMAGLPICHPGLSVQAVGFMAWPPQGAPEAQPRGWLGVLITPWFMNLVWRADADAPHTPAQQAEAQHWLQLPVGTTRQLNVISASLPFIGTHEPELGPFAVCSLMSPMFHLADQAAAVAAAQAVMDTLQQQAMAVLRERQVQAAQPQQPSRRGFLFGRGHAPATPP